MFLLYLQEFCFVRDGSVLTQISCIGWRACATGGVALWIIDVADCLRFIPFCERRGVPGIRPFAICFVGYLLVGTCLL